MICTFFGHKDTPSDIEKHLQEAIIDLINQGVSCFYVGNQGSFDAMAIKTLRKLKEEYGNISYTVVLAYMPTKRNADEYTDESVFPECLADVPPRFAIDRRNRYLLQKSDIVISFVKHSFGGAAKFTELAKKQGKTVINLAKTNNMR